jgi:nicotinate-nucleotide adenylyltransferase
VFVPSAVPPHKPDDAGSGAIASAAERLAWVRLAIEGNARFAVDALEVERGGASYLVETLAALRQRIGRSAELVFLVGSDAFAEMGAWRAPRELFRLAHYAVIVRPPLRSGSLAAWLPEAAQADVEIAPDGRSARHRDAGTWLRLVEIAGFDVSSSDVRRRLQEGRSVRYLLPEPVRQAVLASGVYAGCASGERRPDGHHPDGRRDGQQTGARSGGRSA